MSNTIGKQAQTTEEASTYDEHLRAAAAHLQAAQRRWLWIQKHSNSPLPPLPNMALHKVIDDIIELGRRGKPVGSHPSHFTLQGLQEYFKNIQQP